MKKLGPVGSLVITTVMLLTILAPMNDVSARDQDFTARDSDIPEIFDSPLCLPDLYMEEPLDCLALGASQSIKELADDGIAYPIRELPAASPDRSLILMPALIARINLEATMPAPFYASFDDAIAQNNPSRYLDPGGLRYISYIERIDHNGKPYLRTISGDWVRAAPIAYSDFQGLVFQANPGNDFGWIVDQTTGYSAPSFSASSTGNTFYIEEVIQLYRTVEAEGVSWYLVGPGEWVNSIKARRAYFDPTLPQEKELDRWISVDLEQQILYVYERGDLKFATLISSGMEPFYTKPGLFQIYNKLSLETMQGAFEADRSDFYYLEDVPWTMYYDEARALHGSYWRTMFGYPQSHGCVNLSPSDARWLFNWANEGDWVYVYDPSGLTPTDPDQYGPGAP